MSTVFSSEASRNYQASKVTIDPIVEREEHVKVRSKTVNNRAVFVSFYMDVQVAGRTEKREFSRTYSFYNFEAKMPRKMANRLVKQNPEEFQIVMEREEPKDWATEVAKPTYRKAKPTDKFICEVCDAGFSNFLQYSGHMKKYHSAQWEKIKVLSKKK